MNAGKETEAACAPMRDTTAGAGVLASRTDNHDAVGRSVGGTKGTQSSSTEGGASSSSPCDKTNSCCAAFGLAFRAQKIKQDVSQLPNILISMSPSIVKPSLMMRYRNAHHEDRARGKAQTITVY